MHLTPLLLFCIVACSSGRRDIAGSAAASSSSAKPPSLPALAPIDGDFEPEEGVFSTSPPDPYGSRLRDVLFAGDTFRLCQLVSVPSFDRESAVYIAKDEHGVAWVVSRTLDEQLYGLMMTQIEIQSRGAKPGKPALSGPEGRAAALAKINASTDVERAELDRSTVDLLARACETVLRRTRYQGPSGGADGVAYHAGQWIPGTSLAGRAHSPRPGTITYDYVALSETLQAYAKSTPSQRGAIKTEIVDKATHLIERAGASR